MANVAKITIFRLERELGFIFTHVNYEGLEFVRFEPGFWGIDLHTVHTSARLCSVIRNPHINVNRSTTKHMLNSTRRKKCAHKPIYYFHNGKTRRFFPRRKTKVERTSVRRTGNFVFNLGACLKKENFQARSYIFFFYATYIYAYNVFRIVDCRETSLCERQILFLNRIFSLVRQNRVGKKSLRG